MTNHGEKTREGAASGSPRRFATVAVGDDIGSLRKTVTRLTLFLFGVAYFTAHRVHYDPEFSRAEGFDDVLVTANLLSAYSADLVGTWSGCSPALRSLEERNVAPAVAGDTVLVSGRVVDLEPRDNGGLVWCALEVSKQDGTKLVEGRASALLPS
jgi:acyl dehydratase